MQVLAHMDSGGDDPSHIQVRPSEQERRERALRRAENELRSLTKRFDEVGKALLASTADTVALGELRDCMSNAGRQLLMLVLAGAVEPPTTLPGWLSLSIRNGVRRPRFAGYVLTTSSRTVDAFQKMMTCTGLIRDMLRTTPSIRKQPTHRSSDLHPKYFRHRQVMLEAVTGWLTQRFSIQPRFGAPIIRVIGAPKLNEARQYIDLCIDLPELEPEQKRQFFLSVCRASSKACLLLVEGLRKQLWQHIEDGIGDDTQRKQLRAVLDNQHITGITDAAILDMLRDREARDRLTAALQELLAVDASTRAGVIRKWRELVAFGLRHFTLTRADRELINFGKQVTDHGLSGAAPSSLPAQLLWAESLKAMTEALWPMAHDAGFGPSDLRPVHVLARDMETALKGLQVDIGPSVRAVTLIADELDARSAAQERPSARGAGSGDEAKLANPLDQATPATADEEHADRVLDNQGAEDWSDVPVKIPVLQADGTDKGLLFKDGPWNKNRWMGAPKPNLQESMVCKGELDSGDWFLVEYVLPRQISGSRETDLFDEASHCCRRTPAQALYWFTQQAFGPPPKLLERVRRFARDWKAFCASTAAQALLRTLMKRRSVNDDDPLFAGTAREDLDLLRRVELAHVAETPNTRYSANLLASDMGIEAFITWMDGHLARVATALAPAKPHSRPAGQTANAERQATKASPPSPDQQPVTLKFPRPLTAAQACLDALTKAPRGIPNYEELAKVTGYAVSTIKEAMPPLTKAKQVEKVDGAWHITDEGRKRLNALRGE